MGSRQSSSSQTNDGFISIDPQGNIKRRNNTGSGSPSDADQEVRPARQTTDKQYYKNDDLNSEFKQQESEQEIRQKSDEPVLVNTKKPAGFDYSLDQANEIVTILKKKHKPAEMAGKERSLFEDYERNVISCYKLNKQQPSKCSHVVQEYHNYVKEKQSQTLKKIASIPIVTTILVIVTCLLLHISTVHCFGAMSIDLGSEWMKVGLVAPSVQMDIVLNAQSQRKTAMAIAFANGERYIGDTALDIASKYPEKTFTHFLDLVGKTVEHESVIHYKKRFPHADIKSHEPNSTSIILNHPDGLQLTPLELIAMMLQHAHDQVTNRLNSNEPAYDVVITVPPFFDSKERKVIRDAAKLIGLNVLRLTNVNSAFALSYGVFRHKDYLLEQLDGKFDNRTSIIFFDQGASHTSVTLADYNLVEQIDETTGALKNETLPTITIRSQVYDRFLGGFDMQLKLRDYLIEEFSKSNKIDKSMIYQRGRSVAKFLKESGRIKRVLSANTDHLVRIENVINDKDMKLPISRQQYEEMNKEYLEDRTIHLLDRLFEMPGVNKQDKIDSVIIVGGNTRTPKLQQVLMEYFNLDSLGKSINADEGAALAALYQAASLGKGFRVKKFILEEFGEERRRYDPAKTTTTTTTTSAPEPLTPESPETEDDTSSTTTTTTSTTTPEPRIVDKIVDPDSIYGKSELERIKKKLSQMREHDFIILQRLSLRNSLESLLSEAREKLSDDNDNEQSIELFKDTKEDIQKVVAETYNWLEDGPIAETDNLTVLADKYNEIYDLIHPKPPPSPPPTLPPDFNSKIDLSSVLLNNTINLLRNLTDSFTSQNSSQDHTTNPSDDVVDQGTTDGGFTTQPPPQANIDPPHIEL